MSRLVKLNKLFHLSTEDLNGKLITPRVPYNFFTKNGYEDSSIARISFTPTIDQCLIAIGNNLQGKILNVYEPLNYDNLQIVSNDEIIKNHYVPDARFTGEIWVTNSVILKFLYKIQVDSAVDVPFTYCYDSNKPDKLVNLYKWNWHKME